MAASMHTYWVSGLAAVLIIAGLAAGCTQQPGDGQKTTLKVTGSTTVLPIAQAAADAFSKDHASADIQVTGGGSSVGVQSIGKGTADIGMSSRDLKAEERSRYPNLVVTTIANDGIAVIVHPTNTVPGLTLAQVREIYAGNVTNWKDVGGPDQVIVVIGRDSASGTREFFSEKVMNQQNYTRTQLEKNSNGAVQQTVLQTPGVCRVCGSWLPHQRGQGSPHSCERGAGHAKCGHCREHQVSHLPAADHDRPRCSSRTRQGIP